MNLVGHLEVDGDARVHVGDNLSNVHNYFAASGDEREVELRNDFLRHLNTTPYEERKNRNPKRVDGTCEWFTAHHLFRNWQREISAPLWVSADPGCGKSVLARYLVDEVLPTNDTRITCYFFFKDDFDDQKSAEGALRCILHQLFVQEPILLSDDILSQYKHEKDQYLISFSNLWSLLLKATSSYEHGEIVCVLDALDECEGHTPLAQALTQLYSQDNRPSGLKFILTSRPYRKHQRDFHDLVQSQPTIHLRGDSQEEVDKIALEISIAIKRRADDLCRRLPIFLEERQFMEEELAKIEHRTYLWVDLVFDHLENAVFHSKYELRKCIHNLPRTVEEAYEKILHKSTDPSKAKKVFHIIMAAERPLLLAEMAAILALRKDISCHMDLHRDLLAQDTLSVEIREACGLFIIIKDLKLFLLHQTAREFLLQVPGQLSATRWQHSIDLRLSHDIISRLCIQYLLFRDFHEIQRNRTMTEPLVLFDYASKNWTVHYRQAYDADAGLQLMALRLCDPNFPITRFWIAAYIRGEGNFFSNADRTSSELSTILLVVAYFGLHDLVNLILQRSKHDCLNDESPGSSRTALSWACERGHQNVVRLLLDQVPGWQVNLRDWSYLLTPTIVNRTDRYLNPPIRYAADSGNVEVVRQLLDKGARLSVGDGPVGSLLSRAIDRRHIDLVELLLSRHASLGPHLGQQDKYGSTPPTYKAAKAGDEILVRLFLQYGSKADATNDNGQTALSAALAGGHFRLAELLLKYGADIDAPDKDGKTALLVAVAKGHSRLVKMLLDRGADIHAADKSGKTASGYAIDIGSKETLELLLDRGANMDDVENHGVLTRALVHGDEKTVDLVVGCGANINFTDWSGKTALMHAVYGRNKVVRRLLDCGADLNASDRQGSTALIWAARIDNYDAAKLFLDRGADADVKDGEGMTALMWALKRNHQRIAELLSDSNAIDQ